MLHFGSHQTLGYKIRRQKRERRLLQSFKVDSVCNVVVVFKTAGNMQLLVEHYIIILPCGTVSTFYIANQHSKTSTYTEE